MNTDVSVVIPCYNKMRYVAAAIESALAQEYPVEVIVVDDGSTDGSLDEIKRFDGRIRWVTGPNRGGSAARNIGIGMSDSTWIQFLDADDILPTGKIMAQVAAMKGAPANALAFCGWSLLHDDGKVEPPDSRQFWHEYPDGISLLIEMWYDGGFFPPHVWLVPRSLIELAGTWDETLTGDDDGEFIGRMLAASSELRFCCDINVMYRDPPEGSVSRDKSLKSARSFWRAFESVSGHLLAQRTDEPTRKACLARVRKTAYAWREVPEVVEKAAAWEKSSGLFDFSPTLPTKTRYLVGFFGLKRGLRLRRLLSG
ncbi:glycosyltransferase family A protein [Pseudoruegeria sp. HB172150]|uniref:glycosyltransferase family 2 protein n=1 Tax=Pseudoruegeria sp. HB172150 TaxID=2721164 RepID=UPI001552386D